MRGKKQFTSCSSEHNAAQIFSLMLQQEISTKIKDLIEIDDKITFSIKSFEDGKPKHFWTIKNCHRTTNLQRDVLLEFLLLFFNPLIKWSELMTLKQKACLRRKNLSHQSTSGNLNFSSYFGNYSENFENLWVKTIFFHANDISFLAFSS